MPLKFLDANGNGSTDAAVSAIYYAVAHGAKVINASWGGVDYYGPLGDAIAYANAHNVVFVTAAGNDGTDNDVVPELPGQLPRAQRAQRGGRRPGRQPGQLLELRRVDGRPRRARGRTSSARCRPRSCPAAWRASSGTSMSAAYVSGVAALVASVNPYLTAAQIVQRIDSTTKILPSLIGKTISGGMVDAYNAVTGDTPTLWTAPPPRRPASRPLVPGEQTPGPGPLGRPGLRRVLPDPTARPPSASSPGSTRASSTGLPDLTSLGPPTSTSTTRAWRPATRWPWPSTASPRPSRPRSPGGIRSTSAGPQSIAQLKLDPGVDAWANLLSEGVGDNTVQGLYPLLARVPRRPRLVARPGGRGAVHRPDRPARRPRPS